MARTKRRLSESSVSKFFSAVAARARSGRRKPGRADDALSAALLAALEPGELDEAERRLGEIVRNDSDAVGAYLALARLYRRRGEIGRAIQVHQNLLLRRDLHLSDRVAALADLGEDFRKGGFRDRAVSSFEEVVELAPGHVRGLTALVGLYAEAGDFGAALRTQRRLSRWAGPRDAARESGLLLGMARSAHEAGDSEAARKNVKRAIRRDPTNAEAGVLLGVLEAERGRNKQALVAWQRVLEQESPQLSTGEDLYTMLEAAYTSTQRRREYEDLLRQLIVKRPADPSVAAALCRALVSRGEFDQGVAELRSALRRLPENLELRVQLLRLLQSQGKVTEVTAELDAILELLEQRVESKKRETSE